MKKIAKFYKVSETEFLKSASKAEYDSIILPRRATKGSAGYDFFANATFSLEPKESIKIPTGIRAKIDEGWVLKIYPRSSLGFKYRLSLDNTVGIIDSDYRGEISVVLINHGKEPFEVRRGDRIAQMMFVPIYTAAFLPVEELDETDRGAGGFGHTGVK